MVAEGSHRDLLIAEEDRPIRCAKGMRVLPDVTTADCPKLDVLLVPGGQGTRREVDNAAAAGLDREDGGGLRMGHLGLYRRDAADGGGSGP